MRRQSQPRFSTTISTGRGATDPNGVAAELVACVPRGTREGLTRKRRFMRLADYTPPTLSRLGYQFELARFPISLRKAAQNNFGVL
jgi:hypothetical protein